MKTGSWRNLNVELNDGVLTIRPTSDMVYELEDLISFHEYVLEFTSHQPILCLSDYRKYHLSLSKETMRYAARNEWLNERKIAEAVLIDSLPNLMVARVFINVLKPYAPTKIFRKEREARVWLELQRDALASEE